MLTHYSLTFSGGVLTHYSLTFPGGVFVVLLCGLALAIVVAILEFCWNSRKNANSERVSCRLYCESCNGRHIPIYALIKLLRRMLVSHRIDSDRLDVIFFNILNLAVILTLIIKLVRSAPQCNTI